ncbi:MAG: hypothetical protein U0174_24035 [Polyangiaceae bacterium]
MKHRTARRSLCTLSMVVFVTACGGAQKDAATPTAPNADATPAAGTSSEGTAPRPAAPTKVPDTPQGAAPEGPTPKQVGAQARRLSIIDEAAARIERAGGDCADACRALGSMDHACGELCAAATLPDERGICTRSTDRVRKAREAVKKACGSCPGGTSVEPRDPVPSR